ncbi:signal peptidase I [Candidatus Auribacterota bacterium]
MAQNTTIEYSGTSMYPLFRNGDIISAQSTSFDDLREKDVIYFKIPRSDKKGVHRIIEIDKGKKHIKTKGDGALIKDPFHLRPDDVLGKVVSFKRDDQTVSLTKSKLYFSYIYSKMAHPYRKLKNVIKTQTIFRWE